MHARNYGTLLNVSVAVKEMVHRIFKGMVPHTNLRHIEFDLLRRYNTLQAFRYIVNGGYDGRFVTIGEGISNIIQDELIRPIFTDWYIMEGCNDVEFQNGETNPKKGNITFCSCIIIIINANHFCKYRQDCYWRCVFCQRFCTGTIAAIVFTSFWNAIQAFRMLF